jgi:hypothetical protein
VLPPAENIDWLLAAVRWLLDGPEAALFRGRRLIRPAAEDYPDSELSGDDLAVRVLDLTKQYAGLGQSRTRLVRVDSPVQDLSDSLGGVRLENSSAACPAEDALDGSESDEAVVIWTEDLLDEPDRMVAWFARELGRIVVNRAGTEPPGADSGAPVRELAAEVAAGLLGFGLFLIRAAFRLESLVPATANALLGLGLGGGWRPVIQGCLGQEDLAYLLTVFCRYNGLSESEVSPWLGENARVYFIEAERDLDQRGEFLMHLGELAMIGPGEES